MFGGRLGLSRGLANNKKSQYTREGGDETHPKWLAARQKPLAPGVVAPYLSFANVAAPVAPVSLPPAPAPVPVPPPPPRSPPRSPPRPPPSPPAPRHDPYSLWTERFRPNKMAEIVGQKQAKDKLVGWMSDRVRNANGKAPLVAVLSGPCGTGKTTMAHAVLKDFGLGVCEINASEVRSYSAIMDALLQTCLRKTLNTGQPLGLILDELDGAFMARDAGEGEGEAGGKGERGGALQAILDFLERYGGGGKGGSGSEVGPILCTCNSLAAKEMRQFMNKSGALHIKFFPYYDSYMLQIATRITSALNRNIPGEMMTHLIHAARGDVRALINLLQHTPRTLDQLSLTLRDPFSNIFEAIKVVMGGGEKSMSDPKLKMHIFAQDPGIMVLGVHEHMVKCAKTVADCALVADAISDTDLLQQAWNSSWDPLEYAEALTVYSLQGQDRHPLETVVWPTYFEWEKVRRENKAGARRGGGGEQDGPNSVEPTAAQLLSSRSY